jgi:outer membrane protein OmpA-like peptidoglycan-associated protein
MSLRIKKSHHVEEVYTLSISATTRHTTMRMSLSIFAVLISFAIPSSSVRGDDRSPTQAGNVRSVSDLFERAKEIKFESATSKLLESSLPFLEALAATLKKEPSVRLEIVSHTGNSGSPKKDMALSLRRGEAVKVELVRMGVSIDQLIVTGRGAEEPIIPNITRTGRMRNERVEIHRAPPGPGRQSAQR